MLVSLFHPLPLTPNKQRWHHYSLELDLPCRKNLHSR
jgi:hypothetical protein